MPTGGALDSMVVLEVVANAGGLEAAAGAVAAAEAGAVETSVGDFCAVGDAGAFFVTGSQLASSSKNVDPPRDNSDFRRTDERLAVFLKCNNAFYTSLCRRQRF